MIIDISCEGVNCKSKEFCLRFQSFKNKEWKPKMDFWRQLLPDKSMCFYYLKKE